MSGNAYQFRIKTIHPIGTYIAVNGKHDTFGKVYAHGTVIGNPRGTLHNIRGIGHTLPKGKVAHAIS